MGHDWRRNNVRELRNVVERMVIAADGEVIGAEHVPAEVRGARVPGPAPASGPRTFHELRVEAERRIVAAALERNDWHVTRTAEELGLAAHASMPKHMRRLELRRD